jgi:hypothetical protein
MRRARFADSQCFPPARTFATKELAAPQASNIASQVMCWAGVCGRALGSSSRSHDRSDLGSRELEAWKGRMVAGIPLPAPPPSFNHAHSSYWFDWVPITVTLQPTQASEPQSGRLVAGRVPSLDSKRKRTTPSHEMAGLIDQSADEAPGPEMHAPLKCAGLRICKGHFADTALIGSAPNISLTVRNRSPYVGRILCVGLR